MRVSIRTEVQELLYAKESEVMERPKILRPKKSLKRPDTRFRIGLDFDGTLCFHRFPEVGNPIPGAFEWIRKWMEKKPVLILHTMRSDGEHFGDTLTAAVEFCRSQGVEFEGLNEGVGDREWTDSPKPYAHVYVDDLALGCPLICDEHYSAHPFVDWDIVGPKVDRMIWTV